MVIIVIVTYVSRYTSKKNNKDYFELHCIDNEDQNKVLSFSVLADKVRYVDQLSPGSVIDVFWKPGFQGLAQIDKVIVSAESIDIIELN